MITVRRVRKILQDPFNEDPVELTDWVEGRVVRDYLPRDFDPDGGHIVAVNDRPITGEEVDGLTLQDGDELFLADIPKGIGGAIILAGAAAGAKLTLAGTIVGAIIDFIIVGAISVGLSYGIQALSSPAKVPKYGGDEGPTYNFEGIQDTVGNGYPIPFAYGRVRCGGHFLSSFERQISGEQVEDGTTTLFSLLGSCVGPVESITDLQINGNNADTMDEVTWEYRLGTDDQATMDGFNEVYTEVVHQAAIEHDDGLKTFFTTEEVDAFEIIFRFPAGLFRVSSSGSIRNMDVEFYVRYRAEGDPYYTDVLKTVSGKTRSPLKSVFKAEGLRRAKYEIGIMRNTVDDDDPSHGGGALQFNSLSEIYAISEIQNNRYTHPGVAMVGVKHLPSSQMNSSVPTLYTWLLEGFNNVRVYSDEETYVEQFTRNPAWCCAHWLTHPVIGFGVSWDSIDLPSFLAWAAYCDEQVDDGAGGLEERCTFDYIFDAYISADEVLDIFTQGSGATLMFRGDKWYVTLDEPGEIVWTAHEGNSKNAILTYLPASDLANRVRVTFSDEDNDYQRDSDSLEWTDLSQGDLYVDATRDLRGVTRRTQVAREVTRWLLHNKYEGIKLELDAALSSLRVQPGKLFGFSCLTSGIGIASGRILNVVEQYVFDLDTEVTLEAGKTYEIVVQHQADSSITTKRIANSPGKYTRLSVVGEDWQATLAAGDLYALGEYSLSLLKFRCTSATLSEDFTRKIEGMLYSYQVYEGDLGAPPVVTPPSIPDPRKLPPNPENLQLLEHQVFAQDGTLVDVIDVDWSAPVSATLDHYEVWYREEDGGAWILAGTTRSTHFEIVGVESPGVEYRVAVVSVSTVGVKRSVDSSPQLTVTTEGLLDQPPNVSGLTAVIIDGTLVASCTPIDPALLGPGGYYEWRKGTTWSKSSLLDKTTSPRLELKSYSRGTTYILVKAYNSVGNSSPQATSFQVTLYGQIEENIILSASEAPGWTGTMIGLSENASDKLQLSEPQSAVVTVWPSPLLRRDSKFLSFGFPDSVQQVVLEAFYITDPINVSSSQVVVARADASVDYDPIDIGLGTFDDADFAFDSDEANIPFSGEEADDAVLVRIESRVSTTDTNESSWSAWAEHRDRGEMTMKYIQFRIHVMVASDAYDILINDFSYAIDLPDKFVVGSDTADTATAQDVDYPTNYFVAVKRLVATLIGGTTGDYFRITSQDETGFTYEIRDSSHTLTTGTIHYDARGY